MPIVELADETRGYPNGASRAVPYRLLEEVPDLSGGDLDVNLSGGSGR